MLHTCIMTVRYDFSLRAASIVATQVCQHTEWFKHYTPHMLQLQ